jgi:hypothetical protein
MIDMLPSVSRAKRLKGTATLDRNADLVRFPTGTLGRRWLNPIIRYLFPVCIGRTFTPLTLRRNEGETRQNCGTKNGLNWKYVEI